MVFVLKENETLYNIYSLIKQLTVALNKDWAEMKTKTLLKSSWELPHQAADSHNTSLNVYS